MSCRRFLGKQQPAGNGVPPSARSTHLVALYLAALATSSCALAQLSVDAQSAIVSAVETAGLSCRATHSSPENVSHQPPEAAEQWWQERKEAALASWSRAVVEQEDWLCGDAAVDRVGESALTAVLPVVACLYQELLLHFMCLVACCSVDSRPRHGQRHDVLHRRNGQGASHVHIRADCVKPARGPV